MKSTVVPAQITTVEDRIAGNLGVSQALLLLVPIFGSSLSFAILPPFVSYATYKVVLIVCLATICGTLAIRVRGRLLLHWAIAILRYNVRPRYYVFDKNSTYMRETPRRIKQEVDEPAQDKKQLVPKLPNISTAERVKIEDIMMNPQANLYFTTNRKGKLSVRITEVK